MEEEGEEKQSMVKTKSMSFINITTKRRMGKQIIKMKPIKIWLWTIVAV